MNKSKSSSSSNELSSFVHWGCHHQPYLDEFYSTGDTTVLSETNGVNPSLDAPKDLQIQSHSMTNLSVTDRNDIECWLIATANELLQSKCFMQSEVVLLSILLLAHIATGTTINVFHKQQLDRYDID